MGLDLWFREDVARILSSTQDAMRSTAHANATGVTNSNYIQGFEDALRAISLAFGVSPPGPPVRVIDAMIGDRE